MCDDAATQVDAYRAEKHATNSLLLAAFAILAAVCVCIGAMVAPAKAVAAPPLQPGQVRVWQNFLPAIDGVPSSKYDLQYQLIPVTEGAPMPAGTTGGVFTWTMRGSCDYTFSIDTSGVPSNTALEYRMVPYGDAPEGYTRETHTYTVKYYVTDEGVDVRIFDEDGYKVPDPGWTINLTPEPTPTPTPTPNPNPTPTPATDQPSDNPVVAAAEQLVPSNHGLPKTADAMALAMVVLIVGASATVAMRGAWKRAHDNGSQMHSSSESDEGGQQ